MATQTNASTHNESLPAPPITTRFDPVRIVALTAALFHALNHTVFKSLLFFGAGAVDVDAEFWVAFPVLATT